MQLQDTVATDPVTDPGTDPVTGTGADVDTSFDRYARMVRNALGTPVALVSLVEDRRQVLPGAVGLPEPWQSDRETPLTHSFCQYVVADRRPLVTSDAREDARLRTNLAIEDLGVVAYAGWPIRDHTGAVIGSLCAIDSAPREWTATDLELLEDLASACSTEVSQRELRQQAAIRARDADDLSHRSRVLLALSEGLSETRTLVDVAIAVETIALAQLGCLRAGMWLREDPAATHNSAELPAVEDAPAALSFVGNPRRHWPAAARHAHLPVDASNPLGETLRHRRALFFRDQADQDMLYPGLADPDQVGEARAFLPLTVEGQVYGTLALVWPVARDVSEEDRVTIATLASYTSQAVQRALLYQDRIDALVTLQSSLLPELPQPDDLELAARYRPAATRDQVGGDWYDAVVMPSGDTTLMIGDVVGHDISAAATMGQLRTMLRALAWALDDSPSANVSRVDQAMRDLGVDGFATLVFARIEQDEADRAAGLRSLRWTNAGHPPPLLVTADGGTRLLAEDLPDLMLGVAPETGRGDNRAAIPVGSTLLLYTDGLVERRGEDITDGFARLAATAARHHELPVTAFLDAVLGDLVGARLEDDVAVLAVRFHPQDGGAA